MWNVFINKLEDAVRSLVYMFLLFLFPGKYIGIRASVELEHGKLIHCNWGDDLNIVIMKYLSKKKLLILPNNRATELLNIPHYLVIGSILTFYPLDHAIVWGSGIINDQNIKNIHGMPRKVCAVRGPKTRQILLELGIDCPEVYGDPALLMPMFYQPLQTKKYKVGIIPHMKDIENIAFKTFLKQEEVRYIKVHEYLKWQDFIDDINSCEYIISSSLHGLIIAEAYKVPAKWVEFSANVEGWNFKFWDFYESIGKMEESPLMITEGSSVSDILESLENWRPGVFDVNKLIESCPFDLCK